MKYLLLITAFICCSFISSDTFFTSKQLYVTDDIPRFWQAVDSLKTARTRPDSLNMIQTLYLDRMSREAREFIKIREYTPAEYLRTINRYPRYLAQLRVKTENLAIYQTLLDSAFSKMRTVIPDYKTPQICFAVGCFRGGGTTRKNLILLGSEIALADSTMDFSEFKGNLHDALMHGIDMRGLVAHESVHCQQHHGRGNTLLSKTIHEGTADFLTSLAFGQTQIGVNQIYALAHECELWQSFKLAANGTDLSQWFLNTGTIKNRPPDMGYFVGARICEAYYNRQPDKLKAIQTLLDRRNYIEVFEQSRYTGNCR